jgi:hypothetical protein
MAPRIYYCTGRKLFRQAFEQYKVCIVKSENLWCYPKIAKFGAIFPLKRQYKNLVVRPAADKKHPQKIAFGTGAWATSLNLIVKFS